MLLRHNLKSVPVVAGDRVVGHRRPPRPAAPDRPRRRRRTCRPGTGLKEEIDALQRITVEVADGVVTIDAAGGTLGRQLLEGLAHTVPGVVEVRMSQAATDGFEPAKADRP
jgi:hypothetical protein